MSQNHVTNDITKLKVMHLLLDNRLIEMFNYIIFQPLKNKLSFNLIPNEFHENAWKMNLWQGGGVPRLV